MWVGEGRAAMHSLRDATVSSSNTVSLISLRQDLSLNVKFALLTRPALCPTSVAMHGFYMGAGNMNPGLHACTTSTLAH